MRDRQRISKYVPDLIFSKFFFVFCVFLFLAILFGLANGTIKNYKVDSEVKDLQAEISTLQGQNQSFSQMINFLKSENYIEQEAKLKMGLKKPGENLVVIPQANAASPQVEADINQDVSNPVKWWTYFFKN